MNHRERVDACREVVDRLLKKHSGEITAIGVLGSVARMDDEEYSDIDMKVLVSDESQLESHVFVLKGCLFSIEVRTEESWKTDLTEPNSHLSLAVGSLTHILPGYDPTGIFKRLSTMANALPTEFWKNAVRDSMEIAIETLGRARNAHARGDVRAFRITASSLAASMALVRANIGRRPAITERALYSIFEELDGEDSEPARAFRVASRTEDAGDDDIMEALNFLGDHLVREALKQSAMVQIYESARSYIPP